jgi:protein TonB
MALYLLLLISLAAFGQDLATDSLGTYPKFFDGDSGKNAEYPGGLSEFYRFVAKNFRYPSESRRLGIQGKLNVSFFVAEDGKVTDIKLLNSVSKDIDEEVIRVLNLMPNWKPFEQNGKRGRQFIKLPLAIKLAR